MRLPGCVDFSAASVGGLRRRFPSLRFASRLRSPASQLSQYPRCAIANAHELVVQRRQVHPAVGPGLYGADQSSQLLRKGDDAFFDRVGGWGG